MVLLVTQVFLHITLGLMYHKTQNLLMFNGNKDNQQAQKAASTFYPQQSLQKGWATNSEQAVSS